MSARARVQVSKESLLNGRSLREAKIQEETWMWVLAVRRGNKWIRPKLDVIIEAGDILITSGYAEGENALTRLASGRK